MGGGKHPPPTVLLGLNFGFGYVWSVFVAANVSNLPLQTLKQDQCDFDKELVLSIGIHHSHVGRTNLGSLQILGDILLLDF